MSIAVLRIRSPAACTTSTGFFPSTAAAHPATYGIVYSLVSIP